MSSPGERDTRTIISVENISNKIIRIPGHNAHSLYYYNENYKLWIELNDQLIWANDHEILLYQKDDADREQYQMDLLFVKPDLDHVEIPVAVRAVFVGEIIENGLPTGKKVGSFIDLEYNITEE